MSTSLVIRAPRAEDEDAWRRLWAAYLDFYEVTIPEEATRYSWDRILRRGGPMFGRVATREDVVEGFAICVVHEGSWSVRPTCYLEDLFVEPAARGAGVGRALLDDLVALGRERSWNSIYWHTPAGNAQARKLYDRYTPADDFVRYRLMIKPQLTK